MENANHPPQKPSTIEDLLDEVNKTLQNIQNHKGSIKITPELVADLDKLEQVVDDFKEDTEKLFEILDIDIESLKKAIVISPEIRSGDKQLIKKADDIERDATVVKLALTEAKAKQEQSGSTISEEGKQQMKERKKLFKSIGGDKKWIPM